jgi:folate-binding protein YgfZ
MSAADGYQTINRGSLFFDRTDRARVRFTGPKATELINGMVTSDVSALAPGDGQYAAALTAKGKIVADLRIFALSDGLFIDTNSAAAPGWREMVAKYVNPRLSPYEDVSARTVDFAVAGAGAASLLASVLPGDAGSLKTLAVYEHTSIVFGEERVIVIRTPDIGVECYDLIAPVEAAEDLRGRILNGGALAETSELWNVLRVENGRPEWGVDMDATTLPQEALLDELGAISFTKGCYIGQEVVARIHFRGHVNRLLRKLRFVTPLLPPRGAAVVDDSGAAVGDVRSTAISPRLGGIALGMIRREVEPGSTLHVRWDGGEASVQIEGEKKGATA